MTVHNLPGRGLYVFTYDDETDTLTTSQPGDLAEVTRWERYVKGPWFRPYPPAGLPDLEVGVSDSTRLVQEEYDDPPKEVPDILQHALRLHNASRYVCPDPLPGSLAKNRYTGSIPCTQHFLVPRINASSYALCSGHESSLESRVA